MKNSRILFWLLGVCLLTVFSCDKPNDVKPLLGSKWKLQGFYNSTNQIVEQPQPENCLQCYVIEFEAKQWKGHSSTNALFGGYSEDAEKGTLTFIDINGTEIKELYDGPKFILSLKSVKSFEIKDNTLKLFYDTKGTHLIFNKI